MEMSVQVVGSGRVFVDGEFVCETREVSFEYEPSPDALESLEIDPTGISGCCSKCDAIYFLMSPNSK